jgi:hypothetical protein
MITRGEPVYCRSGDSLREMVTGRTSSESQTAGRRDGKSPDSRIPVLVYP